MFYEAGSRDTAVLSFSGIGTGFDYIQKAEFAHALQNAEVKEQMRPKLSPKYDGRPLRLAFHWS